LEPEEGKVRSRMAAGVEVLDEAGDEAGAELLLGVC